MATPRTRLDCRNALGITLRSVRMARDWNQKDLADAVGMDRSYLSDIEHGLHSPTLDIVFRLCQLLEISLTDFSRRLERNL